MSVIEGARRAAIAALGMSGLARLLRDRRPDRGLVLAYHSVARAPAYASDAITVDPDAFEAQVAHLARTCAIVPLKDIVDPLARGEEIAPRSVALTFDDGYADNVEIALPILERHGATASFFVTVDPVLDGAPFWVGRLERGVRQAKSFAPLVAALGLEETPQDPGQAFNAVSRQVNRAHGAARRALIGAAEAALAEAGAEMGAGPDRFMATPDQLRRLRDAGMEVGAHSRSHPILASLPDAEAMDELAEGRTRLEAALGVPVTSIAYPNGRGVPINFDRRIMSLAAKAGYRRAVTSQRGPVTQGVNALATPRMAVNARLGAHGFVWKLERAFSGSAPALIEDAGLLSAGGEGA